MINIDKEIQKLKNIELEIQDKLDKEKREKSFLNIDRFNEFLEEDDSCFFYNFIMDIKNCKKPSSIPVFYNGCEEVNKLIDYVSTYLVYNKVIIVKGICEKIIERLKNNEKEKNQNRLIILDNTIDKTIDLNKLTEIILDDKIKWHFILKSYTKNLSESLFIILNLKKKWKNDYRIYQFRHNFDIYDIKIFLETLENDDRKLLIFEINYFHFFKIKITNILKIIEFFKEGIEMNKSILHFNENFSMSFDDRLFSIFINNNDINSKLQFYNSPILRAELNNFIVKNKTNLCVLN